MQPPTDAFPHGTTFDADTVGRQLADVAARGLTAFAGGFGLVLLAVAGVQALSADGRAAAAGPHAALALLICAGAAGGLALSRRGRPRAASAIVIGAVALGVFWLAWAVGLGLNAVMVGGICMLIAITGMLLGLRAAVVLAVGYLLAVFVLVAGEAAGWIDGRGRAATMPLAQRALAHLMLAFAGLLAAALLHRMIRTVIGRAVSEQRRLAELLNIGIDWTWEADSSSKLTQISASFEAATGRSVAEFMRLGEPGGPQVVADAEYAALQQDLRAGRAYRDREIGFRCTDGSLLVVRGNARPVLGPDGRVQRWIGVSRNITKERAAALEQQRTRAMLDRIVDSSPDVICVARANGALLTVNPGFEAMTGVAPSQALGRRLDELGLWPEADSQRLHDALRRDGIVRDFRATIVPRGAAPRQVSITASRFAWDGETVAVISARDITEIERAKIEGDAILDHASVGIALVRDSRFERVNPQLEAMLGRDRGSLAGQPVQAVFDGEAVHAEFMRDGAAPGDTPGAADLEREFGRPDGSRVLLRLHARPLGGVPGSGTIWVAEDITERRRAERELAEAKRQAEAASRAKSAFLATMSHEIRTPLNGVVGLTQLLQDPQVDASRRAEYLRHLGNSAAQLSGIVSDVLDLSKIEAGQLQLEQVAFDLHELVGGSFDAFAALGRERGLRMQLVLHPALPRRVVGDPVRVRQILANYLGNALKFTARGGIDVAAAPGREGNVLLAVQDSGIGIAPEQRERLFRPFAQADSSTTRRFGGTGLGLSICRELALQMGGSVGCDSDGVRGSCFWAELPLAEAAAGRSGAEAATVDGGALAGRVILVAEDNAVNLLIVRALLERHGARVVEAVDGETAVALARERAGELHAVLMDLHMPALDGLQATRRLRAEPATARLPVFALSAAVLDHERRAAEAAGMNGFIAKPVDEDDLLRALLPPAAPLA